MNKKTYKVAVIVVNYNGTEHTLGMCNSILKSNYPTSKIKIIIVDNSPNSDGDLIDYAQNNGEFVLYVRSVNRGYFSALNHGLAQIEVADFDYVCVGNNDIEFHENYFDILERSEYLVEEHVICPDVITSDGLHQNPHHLNKLSRLEILMFDMYFTSYYLACFMRMTKGVLQMIKGSKSSAGTPSMSGGKIEINQGVGAFYVLTKGFFEKNQELFFPSFLYGEEATLSWQVRRNGGKIIFDPKLIVYHKESATLSKLPARQTYNFGRKSYWVIREYLF